MGDAHPSKQGGEPRLCDLSPVVRVLHEFGFSEVFSEFVDFFGWDFTEVIVDDLVELIIGVGVDPDFGLLDIDMWSCMFFSSGASGMVLWVEVKAEGCMANRAGVMIGVIGEFMGVIGAGIGFIVIEGFEDGIEGI
jgi:hypothetical protein